MKKWDPKAYSRNSERQSDAALSVIDQLEISSDARILDIGCGDGKIAHELARRVPEGLVVGVDASPEMIAFAQEEHQASNLSFRVESASALEVDGVFELITSFNCLHWVADLEGVLRGVSDRLAPGGQICFSFAVFWERSPVGQAWSAVWQDERWCGHVETSYASLYLHCPNRCHKLLLDVGLLPDRVAIVSRITHFACRADLIGHLNALSSPLHLGDDYREAFLNQFTDALYSQHGLPDGSLPYHTYQLQIDAHKPPK